MLVKQAGTQGDSVKRGDGRETTACLLRQPHPVLFRGQQVRGLRGEDVGGERFNVRRSVRVVIGEGVRTDERAACLGQGCEELLRVGNTAEGDRTHGC